MRILSLSTLYPSSAAPNFGRFVELSLDAADRVGGADILRISPNGLPPWPLTNILQAYREKSSLPAEEEWRGKRVLRPHFTLYPGMLPARNPAAIAESVLPLVRRLHSENPFDLVDAQFFWPDGPAAMAIASELGLPFSVKARGADVHHWSTIKGCDIQLRATIGAADGLLAVSEAMANDLVQLGADRDKVTVHRTGIDRSLFHVPTLPPSELRQIAGLPGDGPLLVCVGALIPRKGQAFAIEALAHIPSAQLALIGDGEDRPMLEARARTMAVTDRVHFLGSMPHADIAAIVQSADVAVLPSSSEGLANAWIEALACGTPLVVTDCGGAREVMNHPAAGEIVERSADAIAHAVNRVLAKAPTREAVAASVAQYSWQANGVALVAHWRKLVAAA